MSFAAQRFRFDPEGRVIPEPEPFNPDLEPLAAPGFRVTFEWAEMATIWEVTAMEVTPQACVLERTTVQYRDHMVVKQTSTISRRTIQRMLRRVAAQCDQWPGFDFNAPRIEILDGCSAELAYRDWNGTVGWTAYFADIECDPGRRALAKFCETVTGYGLFRWRWGLV